MKILFIPWQKKNMCRKNTNKWYYFDDEVSYGIQRLMQSKYKNIRTTVLKGDYSPSELQGIIGEMEFLIASPFHSLITGAKQCVPLIGIEYSPESNFKVGALFKQLNLSEYYFKNFNEIDSYKLQKKVMEILSEKDRLREKINKEVEWLIKKAKWNFTLFENQILEQNK